MEEEGLKLVDTEGRVFDLADPGDLRDALSYLRAKCSVEGFRVTGEVAFALAQALLARIEAIEGEVDPESYFGADGPAGRAARAAEETAGSLPAVEARLEGVTVGQLTLYGIRGAYLYHRALAGQERGGDE